MFSRRLRPVSLSSSVLAGVQTYVNPGDWDKKTKAANDFKGVLKAEMNKNQQGRCVYCERLLAEISPEIEHIAPKSIYPKLQYTPINLAYACHRCNFPPHKADIDVVEYSTGDYTAWSFKIVHPYLDNPEDYFEINSKCFILIKQSATQKQRKKAQYTIDMFDLNSTALTEDRIKEVVMNNLPEELKMRVLSISSYRIP